MIDDKEFKLKDPEKATNVLLTFTVIVSLVLVFTGVVLFLTSCQYVPEMVKSAEAIATDDAIEIAIDKDAFQKETDIRIAIDVINKEPAPQVIVQQPEQK